MIEDKRVVLMARLRELADHLEEGGECQVAIAYVKGTRAEGLHSIVTDGDGLTMLGILDVLHAQITETFMDAATRDLEPPK